jgi:hypothetical protein
LPRTQQRGTGPWPRPALHSQGKRATSRPNPG